MTNPIVTVNVSQTIAPTPNALQKTGALISQGGTNLSVGNFSLITQPADLTPLLAAPVAITGLVFASNVVTATVAAHGMTVGDQFVTTISGAVPAGYNGTFLATVASSTTFIYPLAGSTPGSETAPGTYTPRNSAELTSMVTTFFAQGSQQSVYVLELGAGEVNAGVTALNTLIINNPGQFYSYLVPRSWDANASFLAFLANFEAPSAKTYFFVTTTLATWQNYTALMKDVVTLIESPPLGSYNANALTAATYSGGEITFTTTAAHGVAVGQYFTISGCTPAGYNGTFLALTGTAGSTLVCASAAVSAESVLGTLVSSPYANAGVPPTEFSLAAAYWVTLNYAPSSTNKVTPFAFSFLFGVTPFPTRGNAALLTNLKNASINIVGTGAEGGISDAILLWGTTMDANDFTYWYAVDWMQINLDLNVANAVINGSNNPINPLYYNQDGIDRLQAVAAQTTGSAIAFGLVLGTVKLTQLDPTPFTVALESGSFAAQAVVNAVPFVDYSAQNPSDYKIGRYAGLAIVIIPQRGFIQIVINLNVTTFINQ